MDLRPGQISLRLKKEGTTAISRVSAYRRIAAGKAQGGSLHTHLRRRKKYRCVSMFNLGMVRNFTAISACVR